MRTHLPRLNAWRLAAQTARALEMGALVVLLEKEVWGKKNMKTLYSKKTAAGAAVDDSRVGSRKTPVVRCSKSNGSRCWKKQLRQACLRRALHSRKRRRRESTVLDHHHTTVSPEVQKINEYDEAQSDSFPRLCLEEELRIRGVNVESAMQQTNEPAGVVDADMVDADMVDADEEATERENEEEFPYALTENEFLELLEEIESDFHASLLEEEIEREEGMLLDQISSFENQQLV